MITTPQESELKLEIKCIWAVPAKRDKWWKFWKKNVSLDQLIEEMDKLGNKIVQIDRKNNRLGLDPSPKEKN